MSNKIVLIGIGVAVVAGGAFFALKSGMMQNSIETQPAPAVATSDLPPVIPSAGVSVNAATTSAETGVKEFSMTSWMETIDGKMSAHFSLTEIVVKKGDTVRVKVLNTKGTHDFVIDEFKVDLDTPEGTEVVVEFVADKVGDFEYYCSKYNHRNIGQKGTLRVTE